MSLMHDALKEMDKPRPNRVLDTAPAMPAPASEPVRSTMRDAGINASEWQSAKINADVQANAYADPAPAKSKVTLIAWLMGAVLFVLLGALWWVQSRQSQQAISAVEGVAALNPAPKSLTVVPVPASAITQASPVSPTPPITAATPLPEPVSALTVAPVMPAMQPAIAPAMAPVTAAAPATMNSAVSILPTTTQPATTVAAVSVAAPQAIVPKSTVSPSVAPLPIGREGAKGVAVSSKEVQQPRTAVLSTTTLSQPESAAQDIASNTAISTAMPVQIATASVVDTPKAPVLSAKQLAAQNAVAAQESKRKEAEATQAALARTTASKNASARYAAIGRALEAGDRTTALNVLNSLEQELPASSLTLLRARAWVAGSGTDIAAARNAYAAILVRLPEDENALLNMAALEAKEGKMDIARTMIAQALSANPESVAAKAAQQRIAVLTAQVR